MNNEDTFSLLQIMQSMEIATGSNAHQYAMKANKHCIAQAERAAREITKEAKMRHRQVKLDLTETNKSTKDLLYSPGDR